VRQDFGEMGGRGLWLLLAIIEAQTTGASAPLGSRITPELIVRASTAVAPGSPIDSRRV
jgi:DNA-binding LacI/PurR family transcriptional regulator